jgi:choline dehydrogenase-like flavoprotein
MDVDYLVVGAGAAGCVLADRLSRDPTVQVLLIEAGGPSGTPTDRLLGRLLDIPKGFYLAMQRPEVAYHYPTRPQPPDGRIEIWLRGKGLGGSTLLNGMMYTRGWAPDYDTLDRRVSGPDDPGWGWGTMLAAFRALEDHQLGASPLRGAGGPLPVSVPAARDRVVSAALDAAVAFGLVHVPDTNASDADRIGATPSTILRGRRASAATAFLDPARRRPNLTVLDRTVVESLLWAGDRVVGVRVAGDRVAGVRVAGNGSGRRDRTGEIRVRREVILAAGTVETPLLLERSGIGDPAVLTAAGIEPRVPSPQVGERVIEHRGMTVHARLRPGLGLNRRLGGPAGQLVAGAGYLVTRRGPIARGPYDLVGALRSAPDEPRPDVQILLTPMSTDLQADRLRLAGYPGLMIQGYQLRPTTTGSVHVSGPGPGDPPLIDARFLQTAADRTVTGRILGRLRALLATRPLADLVVAEEAPGPDVDGPDQAVAYAAATGTGIYHAVGSCAMGPRPDDVVDARLRVRGVAGLRVVDASVFPAMPSGNTAAPVMALAWRAAELILEER